jgi:probable HAF family extracellular repeat protein
MRDLIAHAINERGQIVGSVINQGEEPPSHAVVWQCGKMIGLATLGEPDSSAVAINERRQIVGWATTPNSGGGYDRHAVLWTLTR